jgi:hypothetical protein
MTLISSTVSYTQYGKSSETWVPPLCSNIYRFRVIADLGPVNTVMNLRTDNLTS